MSSERPRRRIEIPWSDILITIASIVLAFLVGALLMIVSDTEVRSKFAYFFARPSDALIASWEKVSSAYAALIKGAIGGYGPILIGRHQSMQASIAALEGRPAEALALYRETLNNFRMAKAVYDEAMVGLDMAKLLDPSEPEVAAVVESTRAILERLGAKPYLEQLEEASARGGGRAKTPTATRQTKVAAANP